MNKWTKNWIKGILVIVIIETIFFIYYYLRDGMVSWDSMQLGFVSLSTYILYGLLFNKDYEEDINEHTMSWAKGCLIIVILSIITSIYHYLKDGIVNWDSIHYIVFVYLHI